MNPVFVSAEQVARFLPYEECIPAMREAMTALSQGRTRQLLRGILDLPGGRAFGVMPGAMLEDGTFGAKLVSIYPDNFDKGGRSHQGVVVLFDGATGAPSAVLEAGEITAIRTAAASAAATDVLARPEANRLAILGYGEQAWRHVEAIRHVRRIERITVWGRSPEKAEAFAARADAEACASAEEAVAGADIICTVTAASEPVLRSEWVADGAHINALGSSRAGPAELDNALVARARFFADHAEGVRAQGAEFLNAQAAGLIGDDHLLGEIGEVFAGTLAGRIGGADVTIYKSLGSIVQDLASARRILARMAG
ncbi:MAG TPA: ornithine cyclodeaminase family protein [Allosphingosinicella sp.]|jgi:ornithine cyclodeaminase|nr:ornithine cyclodeaminase family protein [Allosphingosinicella sp.]